ncbi:hypothetical protein POVWA2_005050 [Plasmodium ovale wallikeri]|uniref:Uncharacterized protein n=1 Tax=Plasmodium ovale wallikeri TaxID=864142 RepID=A0A1A8YJ93_PLAOA|nr:hypothetical protein POVWA2_005050 [Plasmodium ovale wallikeri]
MPKIDKFIHRNAFEFLAKGHIGYPPRWLLVLKWKSETVKQKSTDKITALQPPYSRPTAAVQPPEGTSGLPKLMPCSSFCT